MEMWVGPIVIVLGLLVVMLVSAFRASRYSWQCESCKKISNPSLLPLLLAPHTPGKKYMRCPRCRQKAFLRPVQKQKWE